MGRKIFFISSAVAAALLLSGCSSAPPPEKKAEAKKEPAKPPEAVAARSVFFEMYKTARTWAPDALILLVKSGEVPDIENKDGKAGLWAATFVSRTKKEARTFTWAVANGEGDIRKGLNISDNLPWGGDTAGSKSFSTSEFVVDSDAAYKAVLPKAEAWLKTHPKAKFSMTLGSSTKFAAPVWYVMWGTPKDGYAGYVNAVTGALNVR